MKKLSISEAKNKLPGIIHEVEMGESIQLNRHGQPAALSLLYLLDTSIVSEPVKMSPNKNVMDIFAVERT